MARRRTENVPVAMPGPRRWGFKQYQIRERSGPLGRRYEVRSPQKDLVAFCRVKRSSERITVYGDAEERQELLRLTPKTVQQYAMTYEVVDAPSGRPIGEFRKKVYRPLRKSEWFIYNADGEPIGMVTESSRPTVLRKLFPVAKGASKTYQLHWGQAIGGTIASRRLFFGGEQTQVDFVLDKKDEIDRRLALGLALLIRDDERNGTSDRAMRASAKASEP